MPTLLHTMYILLLATKDTWIYDLLLMVVLAFIIYFFTQRRITQSSRIQKWLREKVKEKTKELEEEKERAENSEKAKEQFLANMSHEIRTPLNAIVGLTRLLLEKEPKQDQLKYLNSIKHSSDNLLVIINDILDLSKIEAGKINFEKIDFNIKEELETVVTTFRLNAEEKSIHLDYEIDDNVPAIIIGDPYRLNQIIMNLTSNAIKFTEKGGITIRVSSIDKSEDEVTLQFNVIDTGIGIAANKLNYIFNIFTQETSSTTRRFGGTGLGLSISKRLVELQNGNINVTSELGKGSDFSFTLHFGISDKKPDILSPKRKTVDTAALANLKILLVEDNEFNQMVAVDTLEELIKNVTVDVAENGKVAVEKILNNKYDVVLMDIQMPVMDGYEATRLIRSNNDAAINSIPIIAMTASVIKAEVDKCYESGMNAFVGKPFTAEELIEKISKSIHRI